MVTCLYFIITHHIAIIHFIVSTTREYLFLVCVYLVQGQIHSKHSKLHSYLLFGLLVLSSLWESFMYQLWRLVLNSNEIWPLSQFSWGLLGLDSWSHLFLELLSKKAIKAVNFRSRLLFISCSEACGPTGPVCWVFIWGPPRCRVDTIIISSVQRTIQLTSRHAFEPWLPRLLLLQSHNDGVGVNSYNSKENNLAIFIKITNAGIPFSPYLEIYPTDTLVYM